MKCECICVYKWLNGVFFDPVQIQRNIEQIHTHTHLTGEGERDGDRQKYTQFKFHVWRSL